LDSQLYNQLKLKQSDNIILRYRKNGIYNITNQKQEKGPDLVGLSGCGIWRFATLNDQNNDVDSINIIPTGMIIEENLKNDALIGTRLPVIVVALNKFLDEMDKKGIDIENIPEKHRLD
jgi:hypothetical protein